MDLASNFTKDLKEKAGGILIVDKIGENRVILLGKSNIPKRNGSYESFGGKYEKEDISSLHTAIRELIEEFFNLKIDTNFINEIAYSLRNNNLILKQYEFNGMSYLINFDGLNFIFQKLKTYDQSLNKYDNNNSFNISTYINERIVTGPAYNGLNEIHKIEIFNIKDIKEKKVSLRWFTNKIINIMID